MGASSFGNINLGNENYDYKGLVPKQHPRVLMEDHRAFELVISLTHRRDGKGAPHGVKCSMHDERPLWVIFFNCMITLFVHLKPCCEK